jgi:hypothetical protein
MKADESSVWHAASPGERLHAAMEISRTLYELKGKAANVGRRGVKDDAT